MDNQKLTMKQEKFCQEYVIDLNGTQAAIRAGYSEPTAQEQSSRLLSNVIIKDRVEALQSKIQERTEITADSVVKELAKIGFMSIDELYNESGDIKAVHSLSDKAKASVSSVKITEKAIVCDETSKVIERTTEMRLWDKGKALVELRKHLGIFSEDNRQKAVAEVKIVRQPVKNIEK